MDYFFQVAVDTNINSDYLPFIVVDGTVERLTDEDMNNDPAIYTAYVAANDDGAEHIIISLGENTLGFEDLPGGGDTDFNDMVVDFEFV